MNESLLTGLVIARSRGNRTLHPQNLAAGQITPPGTRVYSLATLQRRNPSGYSVSDLSLSPSPDANPPYHHQCALCQELHRFSQLLFQISPGRILEGVGSLSLGVGSHTDNSGRAAPTAPKHGHGRLFAASIGGLRGRGPHCGARRLRTPALPINSQSPANARQTTHIAL